MRELQKHGGLERDRLSCLSVDVNDDTGICCRDAFPSKVSSDFRK